jgi:hypothetical protein
VLLSKVSWFDRLTTNGFNPFRYGRLIPFALSLSKGGAAAKRSPDYVVEGVELWLRS